jgi:hypothetical protein
MVQEHRFRNSGLARIDGMKVGVGFELFEQEFRLPAQAPRLVPSRPSVSQCGRDPSARRQTPCRPEKCRA